jgi:hypothetical protein
VGELFLLVFGFGLPAHAASGSGAPSTLVTLSFEATSYVACVAHLSALGLDGRTVLLPDGETKEAYCRRQYPEPPPYPAARH